MYDLSIVLIVLEYNFQNESERQVVHKECTVPIHTGKTRREKMIGEIASLACLSLHAV